MSLTDLWTSTPAQLRTKQVKQIIAFAGDGKLSDGSRASHEFRSFLGLVPSEMLDRFAGECLTDKFTNSGFALQDIVNQLGRRLGFSAEDGRYRGTSSAVGFDGIWETPSGHHIVVEVKTSDVFKIELDTIAEYRRALIRAGRIASDRSSILIVVGSEETPELEAQIRGSRHAWDIRLISVDGLKRLVKVKEEVDDPSIAARITEILIPYEYTRVDRIIDLVFSATEEVLQEDEPSGEGVPTPVEIKAAVLPTAVAEATSTAAAQPVKFNELVALRVAEATRHPLVKRSRTLWTTPDGNIGVICLVSKEHDTTAGRNFWYGYHEYQRDTLQKFSEGFVAFGCGSPDKIVMIPYADLESWVDGMNATYRDGSHYRHVQIFIEGDDLVLHRKKGEDWINVTSYLLR